MSRRRAASVLAKAAGSAVFPFVLQKLTEPDVPDPAEIDRELADELSEIADEMRMDKGKEPRYIEAGRRRGEREREGEEVGGYTGATKSFEEQSDASYCLECLASHAAEAYAMIDEAKRLTESGEGLNDESIDRVWRAVKCLKEMKPDLENAPEEWGPDYEDRIRRIRKQHLLKVARTREWDDLVSASEEVSQLFHHTADLYGDHEFEECCEEDG